MNSIRKHIKFGATAEVRDPLGNGAQLGATPIGWAEGVGVPSRDRTPAFVRGRYAAEIVTSAIPTRYWKNRPSTPDEHRR